MMLPAAQSYAAAAQLSALLGTGGVEVGAHAQPISRADLVALRDAGVRIENHGWSHVEISALGDDGFIQHIVAGRDWLQRELKVDATLYAVPFGATDVAPHLQQWVADGYFLASDQFARHRCGPHGWNRSDLTVEMRGAARLSAYLAARASLRTDT